MIKGRWKENHVSAKTESMRAQNEEAGRQHTAEHMPSDRMSVEVERVDLKVDPIEHKSLDESEHRFPEESVDPKLYIALIEQPQHAATNHQCHKGVCAFDAMLDVESREEFQLFFDGPWDMPCHPWTRPLHEYQKYVAEQIEADGRPDKTLFPGLFDMNTRNPQRCWNESDDTVSNHRASNYFITSAYSLPSHSALFNTYPSV
jgi:hypothetical protein